LGTAISEDPDTGVTQLRVGFAMSKGTPRPVELGSDQGNGSVRSDGTRLSLRGLLHFLWLEADLTKWRPGFAGKRTWAVVRNHLLAAASNKVLKGTPLADALYIPEAFTVAAAEEIRTRRDRQFDHRLKQEGRGQSKMILIGEVKEIVPARSHFNLVIKHVPDMPLFLNSELHRRMTRKFEAELAMWTGSAETHLIMAATFALADWGQPVIDELCLVPTSAQWLPVDDGFEMQLIDRLVSQHRVFDKSLGFNSQLPACSVSAVLLDVLRAPVALELDRTYDRLLDSDAIARPAAAAWRWKVHATEIPTLPRYDDGFAAAIAHSRHSH